MSTAGWTETNWTENARIAAEYVADNWNGSGFKAINWRGQEVYVLAVRHEKVNVFYRVACAYVLLVMQVTKGLEALGWNTSHIVDNTWGSFVVIIKADPKEWDAEKLHAFAVKNCKELNKLWRFFIGVPIPPESEQAPETQAAGLAMPEVKSELAAVPLAPAINGL